MSRKSGAGIVGRYGTKFAELLPELREKAGLTQDGLAQRLGKGQSFIAKIETRERKVSIDDLPKIAEGLEQDAAKLFAQIHRAVLKDETDE